MATAIEVRNMKYRREPATGNLVASFRESSVVLVANRSGSAHGHNNITSYTATVDGSKVGNTGTLSDAKIFAGLELLDLYRGSKEARS